MEFKRPERRQPPEPVVPLINVVFLLLVFFMLVGSLRPPRELDVTPPIAVLQEGALEAETAVLEVDAAGRLVFEHTSLSGAMGTMGTDWRRDLAERIETRGGPITLRADAALPAEILHPILEVLRDAGVSDTWLVVREAGP